MNLADKIDELASWYFRDGVERPEDYKLGTGTWLRSLYEQREQALLTDRQLARDKSAIAIWGPSQVGKSTLFQDFVDEGADSSGEGSAMHWDEPILFERKTDSPEDVTTWNPYNLKADASACITRFILRDSVPDPAFPVEVRLADEGRLMHALAAGYLSECNTEENKKQHVYWDADKIDKLFDRCKGAGGGTVERDSYEQLFAVARILEMMAQAGTDARYSNVKDATIAQILDSAHRLPNATSIDHFAAELFWDDATALTDLFKQLTDLLRSLRSRLPAPDAPIRCSYQSARLFNNMAAYTLSVGGVDAEGNPLPTLPEMERQLLRISCEVRDDALLIGEGLANPLVREARDFALLQGVVWELAVPLRAEHLAAQNPPVLHELLKNADLLDFPGVANEGAADKEQRLTNAKLSASETSHFLFTKVLKRGKTASIALSAGMNAEIDGFTILARTDGGLARSDQIFHGVKTWWKTLTGKDLNDSKERTAPLNLVLTFFGDLVNDVIANPNLPNLTQAFQKFDSLGNLANPKVASIYATHYHKYGTFRHKLDNDRKATDEEIEQAKQRFLGDEHARRLFTAGADGNDDSLKAVFCKKTGGLHHLIEQLAKQAQDPARRRRAESKRGQILDTLSGLLDEACPRDGEEDEQRKKLLHQWYSDISSDQTTGPVIDNTGKALCRLFSVNPDHLKPIPARLNEKGDDPAAYLQQQLIHWRSTKDEFSDLDAIGVRTHADLRKLLRYLAESVELHEASQWLAENFGSLRELHEAKAARRYVAIQLSDALSGRARQRSNPHKNLNGVKSWLDHFAEQQKRKSLTCSANGSGRSETQNSSSDANGQQEAVESSPFYISIVYPFLQLLHSMLEHKASERPDLPGDEWLRAFQLADQT